MNINYNNQRHKVFKLPNGYEIDNAFYNLVVEQSLTGDSEITFEGKCYQASSTTDENNIYIFIEGKQFTFKKSNPDITSSGEYEGTGEVHAPMPGSVVKILVKEGDEVEIGSPVIVIEAMKMESTLYADIKGTVSEVNVAVKEQVNTEKVLVRIKSE